MAPQVPLTPTLSTAPSHCSCRTPTVPREGRSARRNLQVQGPAVGNALCEAASGLGLETLTEPRPSSPDVVWNPDRNMWVVSIRVDGKRVRLGSFETEEEGRNAYNRFVTASSGWPDPPLVRRRLSLSPCPPHAAPWLPGT